MDRLISHQMLKRPMRQYVIEKVKKPLLKAIVILARRYPEPTRGNTVHPNSHILLDIRDRFFGHERNKSRDELFRAIWKIFIDEYEHDPYYRQRIDGVLEEVLKSDWQAGEKPASHWLEGVTRED